MQKTLALAVLAFTCFACFGQSSLPSKVVILQSGTYVVPNSNEPTNQFFQVTNTTGTLGSTPFRIPKGRVFMITDVNSPLNPTANATLTSTLIAQVLPVTIEINGITNGDSAAIYHYVNWGTDVHFLTPIPVYSTTFLSLHPDILYNPDWGQLVPGAMIVRGYLTVAD